jgi:hypothetical protein
MCAISPAEDQTFNEARAKIIWGEPVEEVREWLSFKNLPSAQVEGIIAACLRERAAEFRKKGIRSIIIGALIIIPCSLLAVLIYRAILIDIDTAQSPVTGACYVAILYGSYRCVNGVWWLIRGAKSEGSLSDG